MFAFPKKRIGDTGWFLSESDQLIFGSIVLITMAIKADLCSVWYSFVDEKETIHKAIPESNVVDGDRVIPNPKYNIGDQIDYLYDMKTKDGKGKESKMANGIIDQIEIGIYEGEIQNRYYVDDEPNFHILEDEVIGMSVTTSSDDMPNPSDVDDAYGFCATGSASDV